MCGIVGYVGKKKCLPILIAGLKTLEYRGYDSAGVVYLLDKKVIVNKSVGKVDELVKALGDDVERETKIGIGHTRWATHGQPNEINAHPHGDCTGQIYVVHNGIIENYRELKKHLQELGHSFKSETDTEVISHLIEEFVKEKKDFTTALVDALKMLKGAYALAILDGNNPDTLYAVRLSSPLVVGVGVGENFLASDPCALVGKTNKIIYLKDGEIAEVKKDSIKIINLDRQKSDPEVVSMELTLEQAQKGNYPHFMLKEIFEAVETVASALRGRLRLEDKLVKLGGLERVSGKLKKTKRIVILACGTSYYAGLVAEGLLEEIAQLPTEVHLASEFRYRDEPFEAGTVAIAISQSGETADTLAALRKAKEVGMLVLGVVNNVGSSIARETEAGVYNHAGPEIGVASTKAFISQLVTFTLIAAYLAKIKSGVTNYKLLEELAKIPLKIKSILDRASEIEKLAQKYKDYKNFLFLGRKYNYPVALEGALKLKEVSYIHAEGYAAGEMKHGPIALIDKDFPTMAIVPQNSVSDKVLSNLEEIKARSGPILAITTSGNKDVSHLTKDVFFIPKTLEVLEPLLTIIPLQLFAYYVGVKKGLDVDKPRNLAKSVTVE